MLSSISTLGVLNLAWLLSYPSYLGVSVTDRIWLPWQRSCQSCLGGHVTVIDIYYVLSVLISVPGCTYEFSYSSMCRCPAICALSRYAVALARVVRRLHAAACCTLGQGLLP